MLRIGFFTSLLTCLAVSGAPVFGNSGGFADFFSPNSTLALRQFHSESFESAAFENALGDTFFAAPQADSASVAVRILMFDYASYDHAYAAKVEGFLQKNLPRAQFRTFLQGSPEELETALADRSVVIVPYAAKGEDEQLLAFGRVLKNFVQNGGSVIFTGTHDHDVLRSLGLLELDYAYYFADAPFRRPVLDHPISSGIPAQFSLSNYSYPLDVSDPDFISLADVKGYAAVGYKFEGKGTVVYLGMEFYYDEPVSTRLLVNSVRWGNKVAGQFAPEKAPGFSTAQNRPKRVTYPLSPDEMLNKSEVKIKVYPNPFYDKADIEIAIAQPMPISVEVSSETGRKVWNMLSGKTLAPGKHVLELPNLPAGVYFIKCKSGDTTTIRRVVKVSAQ